LGGGGLLAWHYQPWTHSPLSSGALTPAARSKGSKDRPLLSNVSQPVEKTAEPVKEPDPEAEKMSPAEIGRMREGARRPVGGDRTEALEIDAHAAAARLVLADSYLALGKSELATEEYQRVLEARPADKRAKRGLAAAAAAKAPKATKGGKKKKR